MGRAVTLHISKVLLDELEEALIGKEEDARQFIWGLLRAMCKDSKTSRMVRKIRYQKLTAGRRLIVDEERKDPKSLDPLPEDPNWRPEGVAADDLTVWEHKVTDKIWEHVAEACAVHRWRTNRFIASLKKANDADFKAKEEEIAASSGPQKKRLERELADMNESLSREMDNHVKSVPTCIEHAVYMALEPPIIDKINASMDEALDAENEQSYPKEEKKEEG